MAGSADPAADAIFLLRDGRLDELTSQPYASEDLLQRLLAEHPSVISGSQVDPGSPRRWLLVTREMEVPDEADGARRWSLDHLFLDQDGVPTLVEVKRATDSRLRREVVGQMLDYAANAVVHWPVDRIRGRFEARCAAAGDDAATEIERLIQDESDGEDFWSKVKTNLQAGRVRLIFVADLIPPELRRIIEFLNVQMDPAEVFGLEIKQYAGEGLRTLVPRIVGQTTKTSPSAREARVWDYASFFAALEGNSAEAVVNVARQLFDWANNQGTVNFGKGLRDGSFGLVLNIAGQKRHLFQVWSFSVSITVNFEYIKVGPPFDAESKRLEFRERLNAIGGIDIPEGKIGQRPGFELSALVAPERLRRFLDVLAWARDEILKVRDRP